MSTTGQRVLYIKKNGKLKKIRVGHKIYSDLALVDKYNIQLDISKKRENIKGFFQSYQPSIHDDELFSLFESLDILNHCIKCNQSFPIAKSAFYKIKHDILYFFLLYNEHGGLISKVNNNVDFSKNEDKRHYFLRVIVTVNKKEFLFHQPLNAEMYLICKKSLKRVWFHPIYHKKGEGMDKSYLKYTVDQLKEHWYNIMYILEKYNWYIYSWCTNFQWRQIMNRIYPELNVVSNIPVAADTFGKWCINTGKGVEQYNMSDFRINFNSILKDNNLIGKINYQLKPD